VLLPARGVIVVGSAGELKVDADLLELRLEQLDLRNVNLAKVVARIIELQVDAIGIAGRRDKLFRLGRIMLQQRPDFVLAVRIGEGASERPASLSPIQRFQPRVKEA
jgi:hypothetical protein